MLKLTMMYDFYTDSRVLGCSSHKFLLLALSMHTESQPECIFIQIGLPSLKAYSCKGVEIDCLVWCLCGISYLNILGAGSHRFTLQDLSAQTQSQELYCIFIQIVFSSLKVYSDEC